MFNARRMMKWLMDGVVPEMDALDESLEAHDKRFHDGSFDPNSESCSLREKMAKGDESGVGVSKTDGESSKIDGGKPLVTPKEDAAYMDAVRRGDKETCEKMVRELAKKAMPDTEVSTNGQPLVVSHSTDSAFTTFKASPNGWFGGGVYFSVHEGYQYHKLTIKAYVNADRLATMDDVDDLLDEIGKPDAKVNIERFGKYRKLLEKKGFDAFINPVHGTTIAYWGKPRNIKSADPITYDDEGWPIPLSKRFNFKSDDIRY